MMGMVEIVKRVRRGLLGIRGERDEVGRAGERAAAAMLRRAGYRVIARNVHVEFGELDVLCVAPDGRTIVGVEVKTKRVRENGIGACAGERTRTMGSRADMPAEAKANKEKREKVLAIVRHLARANGWADRPLRVDVVGVDLPDRGKPTLRHHVNVGR